VKHALYERNKMKDINVINISSTNFYLLKCKEGYLLIDAGWVGKYNNFKKALSKLNISIGSIKFILITHHHHDHTALVQDIRKETKCKIIIHKYETDYIKKGITYITETKQFNIYLRLLDRVLSPFIKYDYNPIALDASDIIINDGNYNIYDLTGIKGEIFHTPGHSKGSISLLLSNGDAFVGDVAMNILKVFGHKYRPVEAEDYNEIYKSWEKLIQYGAKNIYPSHGNCFSIEELKKIIAE